MPISKPDHVQVQRLEFGKSVSTKIDKVIQQQERNIWLDAIPSISFGAIGIGAILAGYGILSWAGMKVSDVIEDAKEEFDKVTNKASDAIVNALTPPVTVDNPDVGEAVDASGGFFHVERRNAEILSDTEYLRPIIAEMVSLTQVVCVAGENFNLAQCEGAQRSMTIFILMTEALAWENEQMIEFRIWDEIKAGWIWKQSPTNYSNRFISRTVRGRKINYVDPEYIRSVDPDFKHYV